jgi:hypothetical protein
MKFMFYLVFVLAKLMVPDGPYILVNGQCGNDEWRDALQVAFDQEAELMVQKDARHLFISVRAKTSAHTGVDLYVKCRDDTRMLHVSSTLGERVLHDNQWSDIVWGRNLWWTANPVCVFMEGDRQIVMAPECFEFQLLRSELGSEVAVFIHLKRPEKKLPVNAEPERADHWLRLGL